MGQQAQAATAAASTVVRRSPGRAIGTLYTNTGVQAMYVFISMNTNAANLYIGGAVVAQGPMLAGIVNPSELYYASSTVAGATAFTWTEYDL